MFEELQVVVIGDEPMAHALSEDNELGCSGQTGCSIAPEPHHRPGLVEALGLQRGVLVFCSQPGCETLWLTRYGLERCSHCRQLVCKLVYPGRTCEHCGHKLAA